MGLDKGMLLVLFPFFTIVLLVGFIVLYTRGGRPINLRLRGLGIEFNLQGMASECGARLQEKYDDRS